MKNKKELLRNCIKQLVKIKEYERDIQKHIEFITEEEKKQYAFLVTGKACYENAISKLKLGISTSKKEFNKTLKKIELYEIQ